MIQGSLQLVRASVAIAALARAAVAAEPVATGQLGATSERAAAGAEPLPKKRLTWEPYRRFRAIEYAIAFGTPVVFRFVDFHTREAREPRWRGPILFDEAVRNGLRFEGSGGRASAARLSDWAWYGSMSWPLLDSVVVALALDQNPDVAWQMSALTLQAYALTGFVSLTTIRAVARERPETAACRETPPDPGCTPREPRSFPSGHTAGAFSGAGLVCSSHRHLPLYGSRLADAAACIGALLLATTTGVLRVAADRHYASDVIAGAGIGLASGWLMPELLHYRSSSNVAMALVLAPSAAPARVSLGLAGIY